MRIKNKGEWYHVDRPHGTVINSREFKITRSGTLFAFGLMGFPGKYEVGFRYRFW
jgi:hypothetical protein